MEQTQDQRPQQYVVFFSGFCYHLIDEANERTYCCIASKNRQFHTVYEEAPAALPICKGCQASHAARSRTG